MIIYFVLSLMVLNILMKILLRSPPPVVENIPDRHAEMRAFYERDRHHAEIGIHAVAAMQREHGEFFRAGVVHREVAGNMYRIKTSDGNDWIITYEPVQIGDFDPDYSTPNGGFIWDGIEWRHTNDVEEAD